MNKELNCTKLINNFQFFIPGDLSSMKISGVVKSANLDRLFLKRQKLDYFFSNSLSSSWPLMNINDVQAINPRCVPS